MKMKQSIQYKQNFQGEVTSGFIMRLEKQTQENIRLGKQPINNEWENYVHNRLQKRVG